MKGGGWRYRPPLFRLAIRTGATPVPPHSFLDAAFGAGRDWRGSRLARVDPASVLIRKSILKNGLRRSCGKRLRQSGSTLAICGLAWLGSDRPDRHPKGSRLDNAWRAWRGGRLPPATTPRSRNICHTQPKGCGKSSGEFLPRVAPRLPRIALRSIRGYVRLPPGGGSDDKTRVSG